MLLSSHFVYCCECVVLCTLLQLGQIQLLQKWIRHRNFTSITGSEKRGKDCLLPVTYVRSARHLLISDHTGWLSCPKYDIIIFAEA